MLSYLIIYISMVVRAAYGHDIRAQLTHVGKLGWTEKRGMVLSKRRRSSERSMSRSSTVGKISISLNTDSLSSQNSSQA